MCLMASDFDFTCSNSSYERENHFGGWIELCQLVCVLCHFLHSIVAQAAPQPQQPQQQTQQPAAAPAGAPAAAASAGGQPDYTAQWKEYFRQQQMYFQQTAGMNQSQPQPGQQQVSHVSCGM